MKRRFQATSSTTVRDLQRVMTQIKATTLKINQDVMNANVEVIFDRQGKRYVLRCDTWDDSLDNLRAIGLTVFYLWRAIEGYGVNVEETNFDSIFDQVFGGFIAAPDDTTLMLSDGSAHWWEVLGVEKESDKQAIINAYRALAKVHHPDAGGNPDDFKKLRHAYEQAMAQLKMK